MQQKTQLTRYGKQIYAANPSIPPSGQIAKKKRTQIGDERSGMLIDEGSGEILGHGVAAVYKFEEVDKERFVKLYLDGLKQAVGLTKAGMAVFQVIYDQIRENKDRDYVMLSALASGLRPHTYHRGLNELLERGFVFMSELPSKYWVNIRFMFNGDRLAFVQGYKLKGSESRQLDLIDHLAQIPDDSNGNQ